MGMKRKTNNEWYKIVSLFYGVSVSIPLINH